MSTDDREQRFQNAITGVRWWSEIVSIFSSWAVILGITTLSLKVEERMPLPEMPNYNFYLDISIKITVTVIAAFAIIYTVRMVWLVYCWVAKMHDGSRGWFAKGSDYIVTAIIVSTLVTGLFTMAATIANMQMNLD